MSSPEAYLRRRRELAKRPYLYNPARPAFSLFTAALMYVGGAFALSSVLGAYFGDSAAAFGLFSKPYFGFLAMWLGGCSWWGERRNWKQFVEQDAKEMMLGPVDEFGETK